MNKNIDLTKILEGCPKGTEFYHKMYGTVYFVSIDTEYNHSILLSPRKDSPCYTSLTKYGKWNIDYDGECLLFPSKEQQDWTKFERFWDKPKIEKFNPKTFQPFDKMLVRNGIDCRWVPRFFGYMDNSTPRDTNGSLWFLAMPYNEDTKHLLGTSDDCPEYYKWWKK